MTSPSLVTALQQPALPKDEILSTLVSPRNIQNVSHNDIVRLYTQLYNAHAASVAQTRQLQQELRTSQENLTKAKENVAQSTGEIHTDESIDVSPWYHFYTGTIGNKNWIIRLLSIIIGIFIIISMIRSGWGMVMPNTISTSDVPVIPASKIHPSSSTNNLPNEYLDQLVDAVLHRMKDKEHDHLQHTVDEL